MRNKKAERLVLTGVILHIIQWAFLLWAFLKIKHLFSDYTIYNPNVVGGSMQSFSFIQMMRAMMYSGALVNYVLFFALVLLMYCIVIHAILIVLELAAYVMIRRNPASSWVFFLTAAGVKLAILNITGIPFLAAGFLLMKQEKAETGGMETERKRKPRTRVRRQGRRLNRIRRKSSLPVEYQKEKTI
ncbi:membrane protein [Bacillus subtilis]|nr:membrane protein [Bacillus subtilis]